MSTKAEYKIELCFVSLLGYPLYNRQCKKKLFGGGAAVQLYNLAMEFTKNANFHVNIISGNYNFTRNKIELLNKIKIYNIRPHKRKISFYFLSLFDLFFTLIKINPDVVIQRGFDKITGICAFYCKIFKKKFLFSIASNADVDGSREKGFFGRIFRYGLNNTDYIIAQNQKQILDLKNYRKKKFENIVLIRNSYEIFNVQITKKKNILWVGRAIGLKRPELFLNLAEIFPYQSFIMVCNKTDEKLHNIKYWKSIHKKSLSIPNLKFLEFVPYHSINPYFNEAKVLINTSTFEGFPNTFIQAFISKTPVISLSVNPDEILTNYKLGLLCDNNFKNLVKNLNIILEKEEFWKEISQNCFNYVQINHDIKKNIKKWQKLILN